MLKKLDIHEPLITTSPTIATLFTIITGVKFLDNWIVNNFNNLLYIENNYESRCIFMEDQPNYKATIFGEVDFFRFNTVKYEIVNSFTENIIEFIVAAINKEYYIRMAVDDYYIQLNNETYMKNHLLHPLFIYGYDTEQNCLLIGEFFNQQKFDCYEIGFSEFRNAYERSIYPSDTIYEYLENIVLIKLNTEYKEELDILKVIDGIEDYLSGLDRTNKYIYPQRKKGSRILYGIECYNEFINSIRKGSFDLRSSHVFYDRMRLHQFKTEYLYEKGFLTEKDYKIFSDYTALLVQFSMAARNLLIKKYIKNRAFDNTDIEKLELKYTELKEIEKNYLILLKESLQESKKKSE